MLYPLDKAYILHARPYRDTSLIIDFLTLNYGRVSVVARGAKRPKSALKGILQPFVPLQIEWIGKSELGTLKVAEMDNKSLILTGKYLLSGLYMNELLTRVLSRYDAYPTLFSAYETSLFALSESQEPEPLLRLFELRLLQVLGYGMQLDHLAETGLPVETDKFYYYRPLHGVIAKVEDHHSQTTSMPHVQAFLGSHLIAIQSACLTDPGVLKTAKHVIRSAIAALIGHQPIVSRTLFVTEK